ncbi:MAG: C45 family peptidase [Caldilinea sp.]
MLTLTLSGAPYQIGQQHGYQIQHLRPLLAEVMAGRLAALRRLDADRPEELIPAREALAAHDRPLLEMLGGLATVLEFDPDELLCYTLSSYLRDRRQAITQGGVKTPYILHADSAESGCTTWTASGAAVVDGRPMLVKNRDYHRDHIPLQTLAHVAPDQGYCYLCIGSAGSPTVFSSGINEQGLAVADTHVLSRQSGPGLPRFSLMRELLTHHATAASALDYLRSAPHMGAGTLALIDAHGNALVCESGYPHSGFYVAAPGQPLVSTNHFTTPELADAWIEDEPDLLHGNSSMRRHRVSRALAQAHGQVSVAWAERLMARHGAPSAALCRHPLPVMEGEMRHPSLEISTISSVIYLPRGRAHGESSAPLARVAEGEPCQAVWRDYPV